GRACMAFAVYRKPKGKQQVVALVGADSNLGKHFPVPDLTETTESRSPDSVVHDASDRDLIEVASLPAEVEINGHRANIEHEIEGFGGFLGVPSLFTSYRSAARYAGVGPADGMYVLLRVGQEYSVSDVRNNLRQRLPEVDVLTREEFAHKSRMYWVIKTGAGS